MEVFHLLQLLGLDQRTDQVDAFDLEIATRQIRQIADRL